MLFGQISNTGAGTLRSAGKDGSVIPGYSGLINLGISFGSTSSLIDLAWPGTRLIRPLSSNFRIVW